jgi:polysaccharide pyruvyl transferase WcaK-like protein
LENRVISRSHDPMRQQTPAAPRVGLFGLLGSGNLGNDGQLEALLAYLRKACPDAEVDFLCAGPEQIAARYGLPATPLNWNREEYHTASSPRSIAIKAIGKVVDAFRTAAWVRGRDVVFVPGMGVLEGTLPLRPWGFPYSLLLLTASGRLLGTKVALVSVGANTEGQWLTRRVFTMAARFAHYRSFRDELSKNAMHSTGLNVDRDAVYSDLAFALPIPVTQGQAGTVGIGLMAYFGTNDDRGRAGDVYTAYVAKMKRFVRWLVDQGHRIRLFTGDLEDEQVVTEILHDARAYRPDLDPSWVVAEPARSLDELLRQMATVDTVVATRYHNVLCALKLAKPTISIGYSGKSDGLMANMGLADFCQNVQTLDVDRLMTQYTAIELRRERLGVAMDERNSTNRRQLEQQFADLSSTFFPARPRDLGSKEDLRCR